MSVLSKDDLMPVISHRDGVCLSIFMPAHRTGHDAQQDPVRLKNLIRLAEESLEQQGQRNALSEELLQPVRKLLDDDHFWRHQSDGLAIFTSRGFVRHFRVPLDFDEMVVVGSRFQVKPLLPLLAGQGEFLVLAVSQNQVRLLQCSPGSCRQIEAPAIPSSLAEALQFDEQERQTQIHGANPGGGAGTTYHGHGVGSDFERDRIKRYLQTIDRGIKQTLPGHSGPLVLAAVDYKHGIYQQINSYPNLLPRGIVGSPDDLKNDQLHQMAAAIVEPYFEEERVQAGRDLVEAAGKGQAATDVADVVRAASSGRIARIFCPTGRESWGKYDADSDAVHVHEAPQPGDEDLINLAAIQTVVHGGTVYAVPSEQMPAGYQVAALLRY